MQFYFLALSLLLPGPAARAAEFEISASSFTTDGQVNMSSVTYYGGMPAAPANPTVTQLQNAPGGLYFDGTRYRVWDNPTNAWVSLTTGTAGGLLPWSELTSYPAACTGGQFAAAVGNTLTCAAPSGTLSGGSNGYYGKWTGGATMGIGNLADDGAGVTMIAGSTLTVTGRAFSVGGSTLVVTGGNVGIGTTAPVYKLEVAGGDIRASHSDTNNVDIALQQAGAGGRTYDIYSTGSGAVIGAGKMSLYDGTAGAHRLVIDGSGNVGVGTTAPARTLHVLSTSGNVALLENNGTGNAVLEIKSDQNAQRAVNFVDSSGAAASQIATYGAAAASSMTFATSGATRMKIDEFGNVGIGTTTPNAAGFTSASVLTIGGGINRGILELQTGSAGASKVQFNNALAGGESYNVGVAGSANGNFDIYDATLNQPRLTINSIGSVGVGTTVPAAALHVSTASGGGVGGANPIPSSLIEEKATVGSGQYNTLQLYESGNTALGNGAMLSLASKGADGNRWTYAGVGHAMENTTIAGGAPTGSLLFFTGNGTTVGEKMRITGGGNVGVGTAVPANKVEIRQAAGDAARGLAVTDENGAQAMMVPTGSNGVVNNSFAHFGYNIQAASPSQLTSRGGSNYSSGISFGGAVNLWTNGVTSAGTNINPTPALTVAQGGSVGVGTTTPAGLFTVGNGTMVVTAAGNVGVGTAFPTNPLYVTTSGNRPALFQSSSADYNLLTIVNSNLTQANGGQWAIGQNGSAPTSLPTYPVGAFMIHQDGVGPRVVIAPTTGNVGIGTTSPAELLHVSGTGNPRIRITGTGAGATTQVAQYPSASGGGYWDIATPGATAYLRVSNTAPMDTAGISIQPNGNVGIDTAPAATLDVNGVGRFMGSGAPITGKGLEIGYNAGANIGVLTSYDRNATAWKRLDIDGLPINLNGSSGGNVGIGATSPNVKLTVNTARAATDANEVAQFNDSGSGAAYITVKDGARSLVAGTNQGPVSIGSLTNHNFALLTNNSIRMTVDTAGNVGVGTTAPAAALDVQTATPGLKVGATCVSGTCPSDRRLKQDIKYLSGSLGTLSRLKPAAFRYKGRPDSPLGYGLIAQDVEQVLPQAVSKGDDGMMRVDYSPIEMMLIESVKEQQAEIEVLRKELRALQPR